MALLDILQRNCTEKFFIQQILKLILQECIAGSLYFSQLKLLSLEEKDKVLISNYGETITPHLFGMNGH
jgi:hypothetical protein